MSHAFESFQVAGTAIECVRDLREVDAHDRAQLLIRLRDKCEAHIAELLRDHAHAQGRAQFRFEMGNG